MRRFQAVARHTVGTILFGGTLLGLAQMVWYPGALFFIDGAAKLFATTMAAILACGPALTLVVFKPEKRGLLGDLIVIAVAQALAMGVSAWFIYQSRPVYIVMTTHRATVVHANEIIHLDETEADQFRLPWGRPQLMFARSPEDPHLRERLLNLAIHDGIDVEHIPHFHVPVPNMSTMDWETLGAPLPTGPTRMASQAAPPVVLPLLARRDEGTLIVDQRSLSFKIIRPNG